MAAAPYASEHMHDIELIKATELFDAEWYKREYPDVAAIGMDPAEHYYRFGARMFRDPSRAFSTRYYLGAYPDVAAAAINPLVHYLRHGRAEGRRPRPDTHVRGHYGVSVDVVIPVYNALSDVEQCIDSVLACRDGLDVRVLVVNDGSDVETTAWLRGRCAREPALALIEHPRNLGYTRAVNSGLRAASAQYLVTLNSDTLVSDGWLKGMLRCMASDRELGIVGPLSNAASWQNVPELFDPDGSFSVNVLPPGFDAAAMARTVAAASKRRYPKLPFVNGFCFLMRREVVDAIGFMDEASFPEGYGEENDYCVRAADAGFKLAIADDVYVFHAKSKSFGHARRRALSEAGSRILRRKHGDGRFGAIVAKMRSDSGLDRVRADIRAALLRPMQGDADLSAPPRILFLLPVKGGGGGAHSVVQECAELVKMGVLARVAVGRDQLAGFHSMYRDMPGSSELFVGFSQADLVDLADDYDVVVATIFSSVLMLKRVQEACPHVLPAYYVQDYEPMFFEPGSPQWIAAKASYTLIPNALLFAKTHWICNMVRQEHGVEVNKVEPSIDHATYSPRPRTADVRLRIAAMIRPQTPYRGAERTMRLLSRLTAEFPGALSFGLFGCSEDDPRFQALPRDFEYRNHGVLDRPEVAALLADSDLFVDLSDYQAFGRTSLEAMASGCAAVVPEHGGGDEYAIDGYNALIVDSFDEDACFRRIRALLSEPAELGRLRLAGLRTASRYSVRAAAVSELDLFSRALAGHRASANVRAKPILKLMHSRRGDGLPTGSAYVRTLLPYGARAVRSAWRVKPQALSLPAPGSAQCLLIQRDAAGIGLAELAEWLPAWRACGASLVYELDDDLLDAQALKARKFGGDTAELTRKVAWLSEHADLVTVSTEHLAGLLAERNPNIQIVPNLLDGDLWRLAGERDHLSGPYARTADGPIRIGYIGTPSHDQDLALVTEAMQRLQARYGPRIEIEVIGGFQNIAPMFGRRVALPRSTDYPNFVNWLQQRVHWDIGIIPLTDDRFNRSKSNLKFLEYAALDMAIACSDVESYRNIGRHETNALMVANETGAWCEAVGRLIDDPGLRQELARRARSEVRARWCIDGNFIDRLPRPASAGHPSAPIV